MLIYARMGITLEPTTRRTARTTDEATLRFTGSLLAFRNEGQPLIGYRRTLAGQTKTGPAALDQCGCITVLEEAVGGWALFRPLLDDAVEQCVKSGAALLVEALEQVAWRDDDLGQLLCRLAEHEVRLFAVRERFDSQQLLTAAGFSSVLADFRAGVRQAQTKPLARSNRPGRRCTISDDSWSLVASDLSGGTISLADAAARLGVSKAAVHRRKHKAFTVDEVGEHAGSVNA